MWPFSTAQAASERPISREELDDVKLRLKNLEREHDDLHAAYRRLRAQKAAEATPRTPVQDGTVGDPEDHAGAPLSKAELRRKYLVVGTRRVRELPHEDS
jgi:hypothetical protein